jgi:hypothetical protein
MSTRVVDGYRSPAADAFISFGIKGDLAKGDDLPVAVPA